MTLQESFDLLNVVVSDFPKQIVGIFLHALPDFALAPILCDAPHGLETRALSSLLPHVLAHLRVVAQFLFSRRLLRVVQVPHSHGVL